MLWTSPSLWFIFYFRRMSAASSGSCSARTIIPPPSTCPRTPSCSRTRGASSLTSSPCGAECPSAPSTPTAHSSSSKSSSSDDKNVLTQRKELWIFWYGDRPDDVLRKLVSPQLKEVPDISGTWENVLPYEARTLLYKALNNLIERQDPFVLLSNRP